MKKFLLLLSVMGFLVSCTQDELSLEIHEKSDPYARVREMIMDFRKDLRLDSRSSNQTFWITGVTQRDYEVKDGKAEAVEQSRSRSEDGFSLSTVRFVQDGESGYAIVSTDSRIASVLFYTEKGDPSDSTFIEPLKWNLSSIPQVCANRIIGIDSLWINPDTVDIHPPGLPYTFYIPSMVMTRWGQRQPYNNSCPACDCATCTNQGGHKVTGCVATAIAQVMARCGRFTYDTSTLSTNVNWGIVASHAVPTASERGPVANMIAQIGAGIHTNYGHNESGASMANVPPFFTAQGYQYEYNYGPIDLSKTYDALMKGYPVLASGFVPGGPGHAWVVDGLSLINGVQYHCNWGWDGWDNCWSIGDPYTDEIDGREFSRSGMFLYVTSI